MAESVRVTVEGLEEDESIFFSGNGLEGPAFFNSPPVIKIPVKHFSTTISNDENAPIGFSEVDASESYDREDKTLAYRLEQISGEPELNIITVDATPGIFFIQDPRKLEKNTNYTFKLTVSDGKNNSEEFINIDAYVNDDASTIPTSPSIVQLDDIVISTIHDGNSPSPNDIEVRLDANQYFDAGQYPNFTWTQLEGEPKLTIHNSSSIDGVAFITIPSNLDRNTDFKFQVDVKNGELLVGRGILTVKAIPTLPKPSARLTAYTHTINEGEEFILDARPSIDRYNSRIDFSWKAPNNFDLIRDDQGTAVFKAPQVSSDKEFTIKVSVMNIYAKKDEAEVRILVKDTDADSSVLPTVTEPNKEPIVKVAIPSKITVSGRSGSKFHKIMLDASNSYDPEHNNITFSWSQTSPNVSLYIENNNSARPTIHVPDDILNDETFTFNVEVSDGEHSVSDQVLLMVEVMPAEKPTASATYTQTMVEEGAFIILDASSSSDPNRSKLKYLWELEGNVTLNHFMGSTYSNNSQLVFQSDDVDANTTYYFMLTVMNDSGETDTAKVSVTVINKPDANNMPPSVQLTRHFMRVTEGMFVKLDVDARFIRDRNIQYQWSVVGMDNSFLRVSPRGTSAYFIAPRVNENSVYTVEVTATNSAGLQSTDDIEITVLNR